MNEAVVVELKGRILAIRLNRPEKKNALTVAMYEALVEALEEAERTPRVRLVYLTGSEDSFSSGNDLGDFLAAGPETLADNPAQRLLHCLNRFSKPLIAAVNGIAVGIGTTLLLHCDLVYAARSARFKLPFVDLGLVPEGGSSKLLPAMLGHRRAAELLLACELLDAERAEAFGLVNRVYEDDELATLSWEKAEQMASKPPEALRQAKAMLKDNPALPLTQVIDEEIAQFLTRLDSPEAREALTAFAERRPPDFSRF